VTPYQLNDEASAEMRATIVEVAELRALRDRMPLEPPRLRELREAADVRDAMAPTLRAMCERAHGAGLRVEALLVQVKRAWRDLPEVPRAEAIASRDVQLDGVIAVLIQEYYREPARRRLA
jgi:hypothetical protein